MNEKAVKVSTSSSTSQNLEVTTKLREKLSRQEKSSQRSKKLAARTLDRSLSSERIITKNLAVFIYVDVNDKGIFGQMEIG